MDHYSNVKNSDCTRAIFDNCIKTDSGDPENLLIDFSPFTNEKEVHEMDLIGTVSHMDVEKESVNKREDDVTVSSTFTVLLYNLLYILNHGRYVLHSACLHI